jgi:penicillin-binding protein 1A
MKVYTTVMKGIHKGLSAASFKKPDGIVSATICTVSGLVATDACKADTRGVVKTEIFAKGTVPTEKCTIHKLVEICPASGKIATEYCSQYNDLVTKSFITRDNNSKTSDSKYLLPKDYCTIHTAAPVTPEPEPEDPTEITPATPDDTTTTEGATGTGGGVWSDVYKDVVTSIINN